MARRFTRKSLGCWGDGAFGHAHVRARLAELVREYDYSLAELLRQPMTDDASEEYDALDVLNEDTCEGLVWDLVDGDLVLTEVES